MVKSIRGLIRKGLKKAGYSVIRVRSFPRINIIKNLNIDTVFDVGANTGQYALSLRKWGYDNRIISFEPLSDTFDILQKNSRKDSNWVANNYALGNEEGTNTINIANNSVSSSILEMLPLHVEGDPNSKYIAQEEIKVKKLDSVFNSFCKGNEKIMLKIDTQGFEKNVLDGAVKSLHNIRLLDVEISLTPLYAHSLLLVDMINYLDNKGFQLFSLENGFTHPKSFQLLAVNGLFVRK